MAGAERATWMALEAEHSGNCEVSGGTSGIGKATALAFAAAGAKVVSTGRCEKEGTHELLIRKWSTASWAKKATDKLRIINIA
jgi:NAD(P)-dependent dehydrogenase (short-subunit alcohol dehydrogenase family)